MGYIMVYEIIPIKLTAWVVFVHSLYTLNHNQGKTALFIAGKNWD